MSNIDKAEEIIALGYHNHRTTREMVQDLADANLLAPSRPPVTREQVVAALGKGMPDHERPVFHGVTLHDKQAEAIADAILALWPGHSEREVKAEAWDEGRASGGSNAVIQQNPYRATALVNGESGE